MTLDPDFAAMCRDEIHITTGAAVDGYSHETGGATTTYRGRWVKKNKRVIDSSGNEVLSGSQFSILGSPDVSPTATCTLPDGSSPILLAVERYPDEDGPHHTKLMF